MKRLCLKSPSEHLVLCVFLSLLLGVADSTTISTPTRKPPADVGAVTVVSQSETSITLNWKKVDGIATYDLFYNDGGTNKTERIDRPNGDQVEYVVSDLTAGTLYTFTVFTVDSEGLRSNGLNFTAPTAPRKIENVNVSQNETSITLQWDKVDRIDRYILVFDGNETPIDASEVSHTISNLMSGREYSFTLFTEFKNVNNSGATLTAVTAPRKVEKVKVVNQNETSITLEWEKVDRIDRYILVSDGNERTIDASEVSHTISNLMSGTEYRFTLFTEFKNVNNSGTPFTAVTAPRKIENVNVSQNETSITLQWDKVDRIDRYILVFDGNETTIDASEVSHTISNLMSATEYSFTLFTEFKNVNNSGAPFTAVTAPRNVQTVTDVSQTETSITLQWDKVDGVDRYILVSDGNETPIDASEVSHTIPDLDSGTEYSFTLFTEFSNVRSSGVILTAVTVPPMVESVTVVERRLTSITLQWRNTNTAWRYQLEIEHRNATVDPSDSDEVTGIVGDLKPGTKYTIRVFTVFEHTSKPREVVTLTVINCQSINWQITSTSIQAAVDGEFTTATLQNETGSSLSVSQSVSFTELDPGGTYKIILEYEELLQCDHSLTVSPSDPVGRCEYEASGYSIGVVWDEPLGVCTQAEVNVSGKKEVFDCGERYGVIGGFQPARTYQVSLVLLSGDVRSQKIFVFDCHTDPRGVIAGSVMAVLIFIILVCVALFIFIKRPDIIRRKKSFIGGSKVSTAKGKAIPVAKFQNHFTKLSADENRGFSLEYGTLSLVGADQTQKVSTLPENKVRNRFTNVLPYDWNRVKLTTSGSAESSDYINASYMPGYRNNREYIATQGPLPATVNDFWRMIWEQQVKGIVMVTNCTELGRTKCEQYWPSGRQSRLFGELSVTTISEQQEPNWTLRTFSVKHRNTSEERTVKHFHFTAWPDHGVPQGTDVLIQFRGLMRQHIERDGGRAPTVVHCSAGVGRTGTIIALDVLLQQLENEEAVGINAFVHRMRLNRPYMVQTESQYVFLHQCIMDTLKPKEKIEDHIYQNTNDMIYVNATALQELNQQNRNR
ncbi:receptor-type tyrosine-protein phosphatase H-like isoform X3 [Salarias fasciatus]|uniref:receptor-type tyrosine-protein phosphatase H-like isoform X3 n=1 Tax=Salarias fasciatus TaxID=181472 RepID=UPI0011769663|nr:receptor-type tyrosine-protein phosphatase H-like isoform X3 [Salarias fasciatus]